MASTVSVIPEATILTGDGEEITLQIIEATVNTSRYDKTGIIEMDALAENATQEEIWDVAVPESSVELVINDVTAVSGALHKLTDETGLVSLQAHDVIRPLKAKTVGQEYASTPRHRRPD